MKPSELLEDPGSWCQEWQALNAAGNGCNADSKDAVKWAIDGALYACTDSREEHKSAIKSVCAALGKPGWGVEQLEVWNDDPDRTHKEVIEVLKRAGL